MNSPRAAISLCGTAILERLPSLLAAIDEVCDAAGTDNAARHDLRLAVEEACVNVVRHAYRDGDPGDLAMEVAHESWQGRAAIRVTIQDHGRPFDPLTLAPPSQGADIEQLPLGGLGVHLMRQVTDIQNYRHDAKTGNQLTLVKFLAQREGEDS